MPRRKNLRLAGSNAQLLIVSQSGRMLAHFANKVGLSCLVVDCFADADTRTLAQECIKVRSLSLKYLKQPILSLLKRYDIKNVIYGSGLEQYSDVLNYLNEHFIVWGNTESVFKAVQNKADFFKSLNQLNIPFPETCFQAAINKQGWLRKPKYSEGGLGIEKGDTKSPITDEYYWQKYLSGVPCSVLFTANGKKFKIIGFHKQWVTTIQSYDFVFSGLISQPDISDHIKLTINRWLQGLMSIYPLKGLNTLDFILDNSNCYLLEINPRPSASMQLYDKQVFLSHLDGCFQQPLRRHVEIPVYRAYKIIYADRTVSIAHNQQWFDWVVDIPKAGSIINTGMPICSIIACGKNEQQVRDLLCFREMRIKSAFLLAERTNAEP